MPILNPNSTNYVHTSEPNTSDLTMAMAYDVDGKPVLRVDIGSDININGDVNIPGTVSVNSTPADPVHNHITEVGTSGILNVPYLPIGGTVDAHILGQVPIYTESSTTLGISGTVFAEQTGTWTVGLNQTALDALENVAVTGTVTVQDGGGSITVDGTVTATITDVITVIAEEDPGELYAFNNHATNTNRGWTMDEVMRPVASFQNGSASAADIIKIVEYEIGNNNANQSTIVYEWYEGPLTISGAAIPAWTTFGVHSQYRVYQDKYSSNQGNTFTVPAGTYQRHSGIIIGKNTSGDEGPANLHGGGSPNMLTLCMRRVDNSTKLDVWFAFTVKELT